MILRVATPHDSKHLYNWRRDPVTEEMSLLPGPESFPEHEAWLHRVLSDPKTLLYIAEEEGEPVGTGRIVLDGHRGELSITIAPEHRGKGMSPRLIMLLIHEARRHGVRRVTARIRNRNLASIVAFAKNGLMPMLDLRMEKTI